MTYAVEVNNVSRRFGSLEVLRGLSLKVERGMTYGLLGPNGAGKTTLIRTIVGLLKPDSGSVTVLGSPVPDKDVLRRIGYMTQSFALYDDLTVRQNVEFFASVCGVQANLSKAADEVLNLVDLYHRADT